VAVVAGAAAVVAATATVLFACATVRTVLVARVETAVTPVTATAPVTAAAATIPVNLRWRATAASRRATSRSGVESGWITQPGKQPEMNDD
jgi:hypothetical protein